MNKIACQYVIVKFSPYVETGEFANVGLLMIAPAHGYFDFKLETRRYHRVTQFFNKLDPKFYKKTLKTLEIALDGINKLLKSYEFDTQSTTRNTELAYRLFAETTRQRESIIRFSETRVVLTEEPKNKFIELYEKYIHQNFITKEYLEVILEKEMRLWLNEAKIGKRFKRETIGNDEYQATFPFVEQQNNQFKKAIKPLHLAHAQASQILDHGGTWLFRLEALRRRKLLPEKILFTVSGPKSNSNTRQTAYHEITERLKESGTTVIDSANYNEIIEFARS